MDMRAIAEMLAPGTVSGLDRVNRKATPGSVMGVPLGFIGDVARPALSTLDTGVGALSAVPQQYQNVGRLVGALEAGAMAANGDPYYRQRSNLIDAQADTFGQRGRLIGAEADLLGAQAGLVNSFMGGAPIGGLAQPAPGPWSPGMAPMQGGGMPGITDEMLSAMAVAGWGEQANTLRQIRTDSRAERQSAAERDAYGRLWTPQSLDTQNARLAREWGGFRDIGEARKKVETAPETGLGVPMLVNLLQQQIDPGAVVRGEDVEIITKGAMSGADITVKELMNWLDADAGATTVVPKLKDVISGLLDAKEDAFADMFEGAQSNFERKGMTQMGRERAIPFYDQGEEAIRNRNARRSAPAPAATPAAPPEPERVAPVSLDAVPDDVLGSIVRAVEADLGSDATDADVLAEVNRRAAVAGYR